MVFYVLIEWDVDKSLSVIPLSKLLSKNAERVTQKWGARVYSGTILQESGKCITFCLYARKIPPMCVLLLQ